MPRTAKVFMTNRSQAVRLPKEYQFETDEVFIRKEGRRRHPLATSARLALIFRVSAGGL
jgi:virulence-associated protein VagC